MRGTVLGGLLVAAVVVAAVLGQRLRKAEDAAQLVREARAVLAPPFARVPELSAIGAQRAVQLLEDASARDPEPETQGLLAYAAALDELQKGRLDRSRKALGQARAAARTGAPLALLEAAIAQAAGEQARAASLVQRALDQAPDEPRTRLLAADVAADAADAGRALALLDGLIAQYPALGQLHNRRGVARELLGDAGGALADFERASALSPALPAPHLNRGRSLLSRGRAAEAEEAFSQAIERGASFDAWLGRGLARLGQGDLAGARADVVRARELGPAQPGPLVALADLDVREGALAPGIERYRAALALGADDAVAWLKLGNALTRTHALAEARAAFERAIQLSETMSAAHNGLGAVLLGLGDMAGAERALDRAAELDEHDPNPLLNLALLRDRHGDRQGARAARELAAARVPVVRVH